MAESENVKQITVKPGDISIFVSDVDDGVGVFRDNEEILHVELGRAVACPHSC